MCHSFSICLVHSTNSSFPAFVASFLIRLRIRRLKTLNDGWRPPKIVSKCSLLPMHWLFHDLPNNSSSKPGRSGARMTGLHSMKWYTTKGSTKILEMTSWANRASLINAERLAVSIPSDRFPSSLSPVTIGAKRQCSGSSSDPDQERASPLPSLSRSPPMRSPAVTTPTMRPLRQPVDLSTLTHLREALEKARQTLQGPFPTFDELPSDRT